MSLKCMFSLRMVLGVTLLTSVAGAAPPNFPFSFGTPTYSGKGCEAGTFSFVSSPDEQTLSVLFDDFKAEAGLAQDEDTKECTAIIPVQIQGKVQMKVLQADYRGFRSLPDGAVGYFFTSSQFGSNESLHTDHQMKFKGPENEDFVISHQKPLVSKCGGIEQLTIHTRIHVKSNSKHEQAFIQIDSKDISLPGSHPTRHEHKYHLGIHPCQNSNRPIE